MVGLTPAMSTSSSKLKLLSEASKSNAGYYMARVRSCLVVICLNKHSIWICFLTNLARSNCLLIRLFAAISLYFWHGVQHKPPVGSLKTSLTSYRSNPLGKTSNRAFNAKYTVKVKPPKSDTTCRLSKATKACYGLTKVSTLLIRYSKHSIIMSKVAIMPKQVLCLFLKFQVGFYEKKSIIFALFCL